MITILRGDCRRVLATLPSESVHCVVTSPPYWGLRDYGVEGQIGLEPDFNAYIATMVEVFREVRRVLRKDGTCWINLGDSFCSGGGTGHQGKHGERYNRRHTQRKLLSEASGLKPKDLVGMPWRVAFALQADGWWLRQDIIWSKPNPMPESVTDRCTKAHEYIFLMSKSARYYYDAEAIAEAVSPNTHARLAQDVEQQIGSARAHAGGKTNGNMKAVFNHKMAAAGSGIKNNDSFASAVSLRVNRRNKRSVWEIATAPFSEAHFATFSPALIEPCIKAGCPKGGTVLDPFGGAGTTGLVADRLQRSALLIELNPEYADMAEARIHGDAPLAGLWSGGDAAGMAEAPTQYQAELGVD